MKKQLFVLLALILITLTACNGVECADNEELIDDVCTRVYTEDEQLILDEMEASFRFFWEQANTNESTGGYGLINDRYPRSTDLASIASVGFGLAGIPIGVEYGWITYEEGEERVIKTLDTFDQLDHFEGFYYHFLSKTTGERAGTTEVSVIDTALFIAGAITAGEYFGGSAKAKATALYARIDWNWYMDPATDLFYMGYKPEEGFVGSWDFYAEQLLLYVLGAGAPLDDHRIDPYAYHAFTRHESSYQGETFIHSWFGSIFTYQFSHAFIDFRNTEDSEGVNWFENSIHATLANRQYAIDNPNGFTTFHENSWGMTASDGPSGYSGKYGAPPTGFNTIQYINDGTIPPAGALGSIVFTPEESIAALRYFMTIDGLIGDYGFQDAYNFDVGDDVWIANDVIGIDKGITLLMLSNYMDETPWTYFMQNQYIQDGMELLEILPIEE